jgi:hypothetical protein
MDFSGAPPLTAARIPATKTSGSTSLTRYPGTGRKGGSDLLRFLKRGGAMTAISGLLAAKFRLR